MRILRDTVLEALAKRSPNMSKVGERVGPNEIIARDGYVRRIRSVATRLGKVRRYG